MKGKLRWWIIGLVTLGTILNYLARSTLSVAAPTLSAVPATMRRSKRSSDVPRFDATSSPSVSASRRPGESSPKSRCRMRSTRSLPTT